jgi:hypothetical protein
MSNSVKLNINDSLSFLLGNNSIFTVVSKKSSKRYTFKVRKGKGKNAPHFVSFLNGNDNTINYTFLGTIFDEKTYRYSRKSSVSLNSNVNKTFNWLFVTLINNKKDNFSKIEFYHEGNCGRCNRKLTTPESIKTGIGPV